MTQEKKRPIYEVGHDFGSFTVVKHIGSGGYGDIYAVKDKSTNHQYAIKIEFFDAPQSYLHIEAKIMEKLQGSIYFPHMISESETDEFKYISMELLGPSISNMRRALPHRKYTAYSILRLSYEMLVCIQEFHKIGYTHRDIKPGNFLIRPNRRHPLCLIDFGLSIPYLDFATGEHIPYKENAGFTGTCRYASLHAHEEIELSRRDDIISWFYSCLELVDGSVPWPGSQDREKTENLKKTMTPEQMCQNLPSEYIHIYNYIIKIKFEEEPNYDFIKKKIVDALKRHEFASLKYDWEFLKEKKLHDISCIDLTMMEDEPSSPLKALEDEKKPSKEEKPNQNQNQKEDENEEPRANCKCCCNIA